MSIDEKVSIIITAELLVVTDKDYCTQNISNHLIMKVMLHGLSLRPSACANGSCTRSSVKNLLCPCSVMQPAEITFDLKSHDLQSRLKSIK